MSDVNVPGHNAAGELRTDFDVELTDAVIQVKSGSGKGIGAQVTRTQEVTTKQVIVYAPKMGSHAQAEATRRGAKVFTSKDELIKYLRENGG